MKKRNLIVTVKLRIEDTSLTEAQLASAVEDAMTGTFGASMWRLGSFMDGYVSKVREAKKDD